MTYNYSKPSTKQETGEGTPQDSQIKFKVAIGESTTGPDVDLYEETDECDLEHSEQMIWLVKLPPFIQDHWDDIPSDSEEVVELGTVLVNKHDPNKAKIILSDVQNINEDLPREYDLKNHVKSKVSNTFVFTEQANKAVDKKRRLGGVKEDFPEIPRRLFWEDDGQSAEKKSESDKGYDEEKAKNHFSPKVPHNPTAVIGAVTAELQMKAVPSFQYGEFERKLQMTTKVKNPVKLLDNVINNNTLNPGINGAIFNRQFLKITPSDRNRVKTLDKAYRISREELQTKLFALFEKYEYYTMKDLVERLCQPQTYLQEVLEDIGNYNTHGNFFGKWCLKSEYKQAMRKNVAYKKMGI